MLRKNSNIYISKCYLNNTELLLLKVVEHMLGVLVSFSIVFFLIFEMIGIFLRLKKGRPIHLSQYMHCTYQSFAVATTVTFGLQLMMIAFSANSFSGIDSSAICLGLIMSGFILVGGGLIEFYSFVNSYLAQEREG
jgi:hypothetical protein